MPSLILLRGLPGSGKSTLAAELAENGKYPVCAIDDFFTDKNTGAYKFEFDKNHLAYKQCEELVKANMLKGAEKIFVDNTFTLEWEMEPYFKLAGEFKYRIHVLTVENRHGGQNIHGVAPEQIKKMAEKYKVTLF